jgi:hypothetical protein
MGNAGGESVYLEFFTLQAQAQDVRDYVEGDGIAQPWSLSLANKCYDMASGRLLHLPFSGGAWEQDDLLLDHIRNAQAAWYVFKYKPMNEMKLTIDDSNFIAWVHGDEVTDA